MVKRKFLSLLAVVFCAFSSNLSARHLTPEEALKMSQRSAQRIAPAQRSNPLTLAYTQSDPTTNEATVYIFSRGTETNGFLVLAADDAVEDIVLGYSDATTFDPTNIPDGLQWLLEAYTQYVTEAANSTSPKLASKAPRAAKTPIAPLITTKWNQESPYNDQCPSTPEGNCVTGCVATAMAQVMNYHQWPKQGVGSYTHSFKYNGTTYTDPVDFGATIYDWDNMLDVYDNTATAAQKAAVATLMHHCGVAAKMAYTPRESGANDFIAAQGMLEYFNYDKSMRYLERSWFTASEWDDIVYDQLAQGLPVLYSGRDDINGGHEFVCDGYHSNGYFHINWGWGGYSDGYYLLYHLQPSWQGVGGSSGTEGFNYNQCIICDIKPNENGYPDANMVISGELSTDKNEYTGSETIILYAEEIIEYEDGEENIGGFYNYSLGPIDITFGLIIKSEDNSVVIPFWDDTLAPLYGYSGIQFGAGYFYIDDLGPGEYDVYPAYKPEGGDWHPMLYYMDKTRAYLHVVVTNEKIIVSQPMVNPDDRYMSANLSGISAVDPDDKHIYVGHELDLEYDLTATDAWQGQIACFVIDGNGIIKSSSDVHDINFSKQTRTKDVYRVQLPPDLSTTSKYYVLLAKIEDSGIYIISDIIQFVPNAAPSWVNLTHGIAYTRKMAQDDLTVNYTRTFAHTEWQALYVPFNMSISDWEDKGTVAKLTGVAGTPEEPVLVWETVTDEVEANTPYIFKPNEDGTTTFTSTNVTLEAAESNTTSVSGNGATYSLTGIYQQKTDMHTDNAYGLLRGEFRPTNDDKHVLNPYLIYLKIDTPNLAPACIYSVVDGEETSIRGIQVETADGKTYDLQGRETKPSTKGIFIQNGKKVIK